MSRRQCMHPNSDDVLEIVPSGIPIPISRHSRRLGVSCYKSFSTNSDVQGEMYDPRQGHMRSLKKIAGGIGLILHEGDFQGVICVANQGQLE
jgi:hypothetical protein